MRIRTYLLTAWAKAQPNKSFIAICDNGATRLSGGEIFGTVLGTAPEISGDGVQLQKETLLRALAEIKDPQEFVDISVYRDGEEGEPTEMLRVRAKSGDAIVQGRSVEMARVRRPRIDGWLDLKNSPMLNFAQSCLKESEKAIRSSGDFFGMHLAGSRAFWTDGLFAIMQKSAVEYPAVFLGGDLLAATLAEMKVGVAMWLHPEGKPSIVGTAPGDVWIAMRGSSRSPGQEITIAYAKELVNVYDKARASVKSTATVEAATFGMYLNYFLARERKTEKLELRFEDKTLTLASRSGIKEMAATIKGRPFRVRFDPVVLANATRPIAPYKLMDVFSSGKPDLPLLFVPRGINMMSIAAPKFKEGEDDELMEDS